MRCCNPQKKNIERVVVHQLLLGREKNKLTHGEWCNSTRAKSIHPRERTTAYQWAALLLQSLPPPSISPQLDRAALPRSGFLPFFPRALRERKKKATPPSSSSPPSSPPPVWPRIAPLPLLNPHPPTPSQQERLVKIISAELWLLSKTQLWKCLDWGGRGFKHTHFSKASSSWAGEIIYDRDEKSV